MSDKNKNKPKKSAIRDSGSIRSGDKVAASQSSGKTRGNVVPKGDLRPKPPTTKTKGTGE